MLRRIGPLSRIYAFGAAWMGIILMPVYTPFIISHGVTAGDVLSLQSIYSIAVLLLDIPTGYLCDRIGRRRTILIGTILNIAGWTAFAMARGFAAFAAAEVILAFGWTLVTGSDIALIYEVLTEAAANETQKERAITRYVTAQVVGEAVLGLLGSLLAIRSLQAVGMATVAETLIPLLIALTLPASRQKPGAVTLDELKAATRRLFQVPGLALLFVNQAIWGVATFVAVWLVQPYWAAQGVALKWFGLLWAGTLFTVSLTSEIARHMPRHQGQRGAMLVLTGFPVLAYAGITLLSGVPGILASYLFYISRGLNAVRLVQAFNHHVPSHLRATFNSLSTCAFRICYIPIGFWVQPAVDQHGVRWPAAVLAVGFCLAFLMLGLPLVHQSRTWRDDRQV